MFAAHIIYTSFLNIFYILYLCVILGRHKFWRKSHLSETDYHFITFRYLPFVWKRVRLDNVTHLTRM